MTNLKKHALGQLLLRSEDDNFTLAELSKVRIKCDKVYWHRTLRINYTTYDLCRMQDSLNPRTHADIMLLSPDNDSKDKHPYVYARIVGLFHTDFSYSNTRTAHRTYTRLDIAWIRWFQMDSSHSSGFTLKRLPRLQFLQHSDSGAFSFIDPQLII